MQWGMAQGPQLFLRRGQRHRPVRRAGAGGVGAFSADPRRRTDDDAGRRRPAHPRCHGSSSRAASGSGEGGGGRGWIGSCFGAALAPAAAGMPFLPALIFPFSSFLSHPSFFILLFSSFFSHPSFLILPVLLACFLSVFLLSVFLSLNLLFLLPFLHSPSSCTSYATASAHDQAGWTAPSFEVQAVVAQQLAGQDEEEVRGAALPCRFIPTADTLHDSCTTVCFY
eukprot:COSAG05_NODE_1195_length_5563_cov_4.163193_4_plen_225_part_00